MDRLKIIVCTLMSHPGSIELAKTTPNNKVRLWLVCWCGEKIYSN